MTFNELVLYLRFHLRRQWQMQPLALVALTVSVFAIAGTIAIYSHAKNEKVAADSEWRALDERTQKLRNAEQSRSEQPPVLPVFRSKHLVEVIGRTAESMKMPLEEIQFSLEDNGNQPYLRYRATLTVSSSYSVVRDFLALLHEEVAGISIDTISCARADIGVSELTCDIAVSAFYQRSDRG